MEAGHESSARGDGIAVPEGGYMAELFAVDAHVATAALLVHFCDGSYSIDVELHSLLRLSGGNNFLGGGPDGLEDAFLDVFRGFLEGGEVFLRSRVEEAIIVEERWWQIGGLSLRTIPLYFRAMT